MNYCMNFYTITLTSIIVNFLGGVSTGSHSLLTCESDFCMQTVQKKKVVWLGDWLIDHVIDEFYL